LYPESILIRDFVGKVDVKEIIASWEYLIENKLIKYSIKGVINNLTRCDLLIDMESFKTLIDFLKKQDYLKGIKLAVICTNPVAIVFPTLGEYREPGLKIKPFTTMDAAVSWVLTEP
jgi:hypothetical protein